MSHGIDYGMGKTNIDPETGIRFGVIPAQDVGQAWYDESEFIYADPSCPKCGGDLDEENDFYCCKDCEESFGADEIDRDEKSPVRFEVNDADVKATCDGDGTDIFVLSSIYFTRAAFCSPCAPGACHLRNPCDDGERCYCFGHDWFEDGKAPYPVYLVATGEEVKP